MVDNLKLKNDKPHVPIHDLFGNQVILLDAQASQIEHHEYSAFGETDTSSSTPWSYRSKRTTQGLIDFGRRLYSPSLGRFLTPDPEGYTDGPNHPLTAQDPLGLIMTQFNPNWLNMGSGLTL